MISCSELLGCLEAAGVDFFVGVPDSLLKNFCACVTDTRPDVSAPSFLEIRVAKGARPDLGRPKDPPQANKALFMDMLSKDC